MVKIRVEKYADNNGIVWMHVKFLDHAKTEVIMREEEFLKSYGKMVCSKVGDRI